ncbi:hypothetical protein ACH5RR_023491 [Cinchona calisaya]|uniref:Uncharacterized protein n=1 Tax=Cinchona calisaya TaxID=153742 RepID=A0ABD2ZBX7_9GENT
MNFKGKNIPFDRDLLAWAGLVPGGHLIEGFEVDVMINMYLSAASPKKTVVKQKSASVPSHLTERSGLGMTSLKKHLPNNYA